MWLVGGRGFPLSQRSFLLCSLSWKVTCDRNLYGRYSKFAVNTDTKYKHSPQTMYRCPCPLATGVCTYVSPVSQYSIFTRCPRQVGYDIHSTSCLKKRTLRNHRLETLMQKRNTFFILYLCLYGGWYLPRIIFFLELATRYEYKAVLTFKTRFIYQQRVSNIWNVFWIFATRFKL